MSNLHSVGSPVGLVDVGVDWLHGSDHVHAVLVVHRVGLSDRGRRAREWGLGATGNRRDGGLGGIGGGREREWAGREQRMASIDATSL